MHEAQTIATFVLTAALALLALGALLVVGVAAVVSMRVAGAVQAAARDGARAMRALAQTAEATARLSRRAERGVRRLGHRLSRTAFMESLLGSRRAGIAVAVITALEGAGAAFQAFMAVRRQAAAQAAPAGGGEEGTTHVG